MPVYALNAPPDARCDCGPNLLCTHGATAPTDPAGTTRSNPPPTPAADSTNNEGSTHRV
jgi:hypothetical protein